MWDSTVLFAFGLTLFCRTFNRYRKCHGIFCKKTNTKFLSIALGFSAGVMLYVSFVEIFVKAKDALIAELGTRNGLLGHNLGFFRRNAAYSYYR